MTSWLSGAVHQAVQYGFNMAGMTSLYEPFGMGPEWRGSGRDSIATPMIVHNTGGLGEQVRHGVDGFLFGAEGSRQDWRDIFLTKMPYDRMGIPTFNACLLYTSPSPRDS